MKKGKASAKAAAQMDAQQTTLSDDDFDANDEKNLQLADISQKLTGMDELKTRLSKLEELLAEMRTSIASLSPLQKKDMPQGATEEESKSAGVAAIPLSSGLQPPPSAASAPPIQTTPTRHIRTNNTHEEKISPVP